MFPTEVKVGGPTESHSYHILSNIATLISGSTESHSHYILTTTATITISTNLRRM